jgi:Cell division protein FtsI/penicillin-binding protein 2
MSSRVNIYSGRNFFLLGLLLLGFLFLFSRLFYLKLFQDSFLEERSFSEIKTVYQIPARRGKILDRNGRILALDIISYSLELDKLTFNISNDKNLSLLSEIIKSRQKNDYTKVKFF